MTTRGPARLFGDKSDSRWGSNMSWLFKVKDVTPKVIISVDVETSVTEAAKVMLENKRGAVVVTENGDPVGLVTERDVSRKVAAKGLHPQLVKVRSIMTSPLITVDMEAPVAEAIDLMLTRGIKRLLATENEKIVGVFTQGDVLNVYRTCGACHKQIPSSLSPTQEKHLEGFIECTCGARYHRSCAEQVVYCLNCQLSLVTSVVYPSPEETMGG